MVVNVTVIENLTALLDDEDTDGDRKITVADPPVAGSRRGDRRFDLRGSDGASHPISGTYPLSNLLQELARAVERGDSVTTIHFDLIYEPPSERISRMIRTRYWDNLTRRIDGAHIADVLKDEKTGDRDLRYIYVPYDDTLALTHLKAACDADPELRCSVVRLPRKITPEYVRGLDGRHGILSLELRAVEGDVLEGVPFVVPGGRFNEMYGWDSYFEALGLLVDGRVDLARAMVDNFVYEIQHYGKILNANRTYYLTRSQPPFLTSMIRAVYARLSRSRESREWLRRSLLAAIDEYRNVWMREPHLTEMGLSRYYGSGIGPCPEVEPGHYDRIYREFAGRRGMDIDEFVHQYMTGMLEEPELDRFFVHDRAMRESGHDTSYRWHTGRDRCADFVTVDLNSLLFRYETDIAAVIEREFDGGLEGRDGTDEASEDWYGRAARRKALMREYLWDTERGLFIDYDVVNRRRHQYISAAAFYPLWASNLADPRSTLLSREEARSLVDAVLPLLEMPGGVAASARESRGDRSDERPDRQWDYPYGWAPHQMLVWQGLRNFGFDEERRRLVYRWLYTITRNAVDYNGTVPEKFNVVTRSHRVFAEYGNVGTEFDYITREGFGWMNASYQVGLDILGERIREQLNELVPPESKSLDLD
jgi:alpha,alpha-trehalase